jgi:hypothetical protein
MPSPPTFTGTSHAPMRYALPLFLLTFGSANGQSILLSDFEDNGNFDLSGVTTYCSLAAVQGSTDTPDGSLWSAEISALFDNSCPEPAITQGLFFALPGLTPGNQFTITFQYKVPQNGALSMNLFFVYPASGNLPASEWDLGFPEVGDYRPGEGAWTLYTGNFTVPTSIPSPADLYFVIHYAADQVDFLSAYIDNVILTSPDINTGVHGATAASASLSVSPLPATDRIAVSGLVAGRTVEVLNGAGARMTQDVPTSGPGVCDISALAPGLYMLRQGARCVRFIKE